MVSEENGKVEWTEKITNEKVLNKKSQKFSIFSDIAKRQISFFGHIMRKDKLEYLARTGKKVGREYVAEGERCSKTNL